MGYGLRSLSILILIFICFATVAVTAPTGASDGITSSKDESPAAFQAAGSRDGDFPGVLADINDTVHRTRVSRASNPSEDTDVLDDLERLLDIIAGHVGRMREAANGTGQAARPGTRGNAAPASAAGSSAAQELPTGTDGPASASARGRGPGARERPAVPDDSVDTDARNPGNPAATPDHLGDAAGPLPVIVNYDAMFPHDGDRPPEPQQQQQGGGGPQVQHTDLGPSGGGTSFNITCKGISVCNPVTVINGKGGKKIKLDKLEKAVAKGRKKTGRQKD